MKLLESYIKALLETDYAKSDSSTFHYKDHEYKVKDLIEVMKDHDKYPIESKSAKELIDKNRDEDPWTWEGKLTFGDYIDHYDRAVKADFKYPIIIAPNGQILDGNHRLLKAHIEKKGTLDIQVCHDIGKKSCKLEGKKI